MKKNDVHEKIISVFSIAGLMTAFISLITTQQGLKQYTFSKDWQAFFISFSIQSALFVCNMKISGNKGISVYKWCGNNICK